MHRFSNCCCCCSLRTGSLVLGWLTVIGSVGNILTSFKKILILWDVEDQIREVLKNISGEQSQLQYDCDNSCVHFIANFVYAIIILTLLCNITLLVIASLLIHGINKNRPNLMTPYIVYMFGTVGLMIAMTIVGLVFLIKVPIGAFVLILIILPVIMLNVYFALIIRSCQTEIREEMLMLPGRLHDGDQMGTMITYSGQQHQADYNPANQVDFYPTNKPAYSDQSPAHTDQRPAHTDQPPAYTDQPPAFSDQPPPPAYGFKM